MTTFLVYVVLLHLENILYDRGINMVLLSITFYETKCTLSDEKTLPFRYLTKFAETSCNSLGIELTQHKHFSEEVAKWKIGFVKIKKRR